MAKCDQECSNRAKFFVSQSTIPQRLADGTMESEPAARSTLCCGNHLAFVVTMLGTLPFKTNSPVKVTLQ